jgi:spore maturation protein CgeB
VNQLSFVFLGLAITSSWGNGHATTYRALLRELARRGHELTFLERNLPFYAKNRDLPEPDYAQVELYESIPELRERFTKAISRADVVVVGSYVPEGIAVSDWVLANAKGTKAFYDIDTPITMRGLERGGAVYLEPRQAAKYDLYLSFTGGPALARFARQFGLRAARPLYCSVDPELYFPDELPQRWELGYLGTYSADRQPALERLLFTTARRAPSARFALAGPQYPGTIVRPENVHYVEHLAPGEHRAFYNAQRFTLNVTRADMVEAGYSPSVRLFEAAACGTPIISDIWSGIAQFFEPGKEIVLARDAHDVMSALFELPERRRLEIGSSARRRVLAEHTAQHRAETLEQYLFESRKSGRHSSSHTRPRVAGMPPSDVR